MRHTAFDDPVRILMIQPMRVTVLTLLMELAVCGCGSSDGFPPDESMETADGSETETTDAGEESSEEPNCWMGGFDPGFAHSVSSYTLRQEARVLTKPLVVKTTGYSCTLPKGTGVVLLRSLLLDGVSSYVLVEESNFSTALVDSSSLEQSSTPASGAELDDFRYLNALKITRAGALCCLVPNNDNWMRVTLTVDLCQSSRAWEEELFGWLINFSEQLGRPASVGIAVTGLWASAHPDEFQQLVSWQVNGKLDILWINHSYNHPLSPDQNGTYQFLTDPSVDFNKEVLDLELALLEHGVLFSALFRFPGLVHDDRTRGLLNDLGLFPLDANAWLALGQEAEDDSVILVHGNGNEPQGVDLFLEWKDQNETELLSGAIQLEDPLWVLPLAGSDLGDFVACPEVLAARPTDLYWFYLQQ